MQAIQDKEENLNINIVKEELKKHLNKKITIKAHGMRNKVNYYEGTLKTLYPNIFTIKYNNTEKSFSYADLITGEIKIKYD